jgi:hypothetical protein
VRVVAVDAASVTKAALVLTMANTMAKQDIGQMLVRPIFTLIAVFLL